MTNVIRKRAYARAGLIGNPSDGYNGKTVAFSVKNFCAEVALSESEGLQFIESQSENCFRSIQALHRDICMHGYYGGTRLMKATVKVFFDYCKLTGQALRPDNFSLAFQSEIPKQVGMAGSSAIIVATLRALMDFYSVRIDKQVQPSLVFAVEHDELGIGGGLQDRVIQVYEGVVAMDFSFDAMTNVDGFMVGRYVELDKNLLPPLYIAYRTASSEPTEVFHNNLRERFLAGDQVVVKTMKKFAILTDRVVESLYSGDNDALAAQLNENFDLRQSMCDLNPLHVEMIGVARSVGVSAKYAGSGGAIVGCYTDNVQFEKLEKAMREIGCELVKPVI